MSHQKASKKPLQRFFTRLCISILFFFSLTYAGNSQGIPFIRHFSKADYTGGTQSWDFTQDTDGILYIANNDGLGEFDGVTWKMHPVDNKTIVRSLVIDKQKRIYSGAQGELGFFYPDAFGRLQYVSFQKQLQQLERKPEDFWNGLLAQDGTVLFQSSNQIVGIQGTQITTWHPVGNFIYMQRLGSRVIAQDSRRGLVEIKPDGQTGLLLPLADDQLEIVSILEPTNSPPIICTRSGALYQWHSNTLTRWHTEAASYLYTHRLYTALRLPDGKIALGTSQGGVVLLHPDGRIQIIFTRKNGLQNNNILSLFADRQGNLWAGTDNGVDYIQVNAPYSFVIPDGDLEGTAYGGYILQNTAYLATSNGLYSGQQQHNEGWGTSSFSLVPQTQGQAWSVQHSHKGTFLGHHEGPFILTSENQAQPLGAVKGAWSFVSLESTPNLLLCGAYDGIYLFEKKADTWVKKLKYPGLNESCRILALENDHQLWIAHPYRGIFSVRLSTDYSNAEIRFFNASNGLPSDNFNHVFKISDQIVFATEKGLFRFDKLNNSFERYPLLDDLFQSYKRVKYLQQGRQGEIWFAADNDVGYLKPQSAKGTLRYQRVVLPFLRGKLVGGFEFIYPYHEKSVLFGTDKGFIFLDQTRKPTNPGKVLLREVRLTHPNDSLLYVSRGATAQAFPPEINLRAHQNTLLFKFVLPDLTLEPGIQYRWRLMGLSPQWSAWSSENQRDFTQLRPGKYRFEVEARIAEGEKPTRTTCSFRIYPPWYISSTARFIYLIFTALGLLLLVIVPQRRFAREKENLTIAHQREQEEQQLQVEAAQKEVQLIREAKLQDEIEYKNQELAATTFHLVQKSEILHTTSEQLIEINQYCTDEHTRKAIAALIRGLTQPNQLDKDWEVFTQRFDQVHADFLRRLKEKFPQITPKDQKLCAYLRLNLSSKEIAPLLGISVRSVEVSRYRLRRKLDLDTEENLTAFLLQF